MNEKMNITVDFDALYLSYCALGQNIQELHEELRWYEENEPQWVEVERRSLNKSIRAYNEISRALGREYDCKEEV